MNRDDVIAMAESLAICTSADSKEFDHDGLIRFAALVAAKEREACARIAESEQYGEPANEYQDGCDRACKTIAKAIRARGQEAV